MPWGPATRVSTLRAAALLLFLLSLPLASAHAVLQSATPAPNGHADENVTVVEFRFSEHVEREYTGADVRDILGESWAAGPVEFDPENANIIRLPVKPLPSGIYAASWKALSVDTHTTRGSFVFAVGNATLRPGEYAVDASDPADHDTASVLRDGFARFAFFTGLFLTLGIPIFSLAVLRETRPAPSLYATAASFGAVGAAGALVVMLFLSQRTGLGLDVLDTAPGRSLAWRALLVLAASAACALVLWRPGAWRGLSFLAILLGIGAVAATSLGSHAAALKDRTWLYIAADAAHLAMGAVWIGGVVSLIHAIVGRGAIDVAALVYRFSPIAIASVLVLVGTGTLASVAHMPCTREGDAWTACPDALRTELYMQLVAAKVLLMVPLVALGAYNKYRVGPRLARGAFDPTTFRRIVQVEAGIMALVLLAAGVLAASAPPEREVEGANAPPPVFEVENQTKMSHVILHVSPNPVVVGIQKVVVIVHPLGSRLPNDTFVQLKLWPEGEREPDTNLDLVRATPNEWEIESGLFTHKGTWNVLVLIQRSDEGFVKLPFKVPVENPATT